MSRLVGSVWMQVLLEIGRDLRGLRQHVGRRADDVDGFARSPPTPICASTGSDLRRRQRDGLRDALEAAQLEGHRVGAGRQPRQHVVAVLRRDGCCGRPAGSATWR